MSYELVPLKLKDGTESNVVYFLCDDGLNPLTEFAKECRDKLAVAKITKAIEAVHEIGVDMSRHSKRLKKLEGSNDNDLYEIVTNKCTARAYSFLIDGELAIVIALIIQKTHSGKGKKDVSGGIERLQNKRPQLEEALKRRSSHGEEL